MLWAGREGQPGAGQVAFHERISAAHLRGGVNWIETAPAGSAGDRSAGVEGIDAYFFPVPAAAPAPAGTPPSR
jgi:hypothetical protein